MIHGWNRKQTYLLAVVLMLVSMMLLAAFGRRRLPECGTHAAGGGRTGGRGSHGSGGSDDEHGGILSGRLRLSGAGDAHDQGRGGRREGDGQPDGQERV